MPRQSRSTGPYTISLPRLPHEKPHPGQQNLLVEVGLFLFGKAIAPQQIGQVLRESCTRHHRVTARFYSLRLQIPLQMREESDDRRAPLELRLQLRNQRQRFGIRVVEVEDDQPWPILLLTANQLRNRFLIVFDEGHLHAKLARSLLNLCDKEEIFDEEEDLGRRVLGDRNSLPLRVVDRLRVALIAASAAVAVASAIVAVGRDRGGRRVGEVAVHRAIAVVHWADKAARPALLLAATPATLAFEAVVARLVGIASAEAAAVAAAGLVAGILLRALTIAVAELLLPALAAAAAVLLLAATGLQAL